MPVAHPDARKTLCVGRPRPVRTRGGTLVLRKKAILGGLAAALLGMSAGSPHVVAAFGSTRTISFFHIHTKETLTITYKRDGKYDPEALKQIDWIMRDWRQSKAIEMDPKTIDLLWEMHTELGSKEPIHIICGYRSEATNNMLRRTVGGQAKKSKHMTGQAIDATFPDIPLKQLRWSAIIREVGGVGYYPTSGIPFVHVDTGAVRAWPRVPRTELALLFPNGKTKHKPADGGSIDMDDVRKARANKEVATQVAAYFELRNNPRPAVFAEVPAPMLKGPPQEVARPAPEVRVASLDAAPLAAPAPKLVRGPRPAVPPPSAIDRGRLDQLVTLASLDPADALVPLRSADADRRGLDTLVSAAAIEASASPAPVAQAVPPETQVAALDVAKIDPVEPPNGAHGRWAPAPEFDDDHPEELSYRPFPVAPLLTQSASADDEALVKIVHPNLERTLDLLDDRQIVLPMRLRPGDQIAEVLWAQQFQGSAVDFSAHERDPQRAATGLTSRPVKTTAR
ncbi:MAG: DUF882 domain-containing protein [Hyphomicrobium sp.]|nr:MAG: DUF882 domain-containing protein [Hyphomicrobium sp.]